MNRESKTNWMEVAPDTTVRKLLAFGRYTVKMEYSPHSRTARLSVHGWCLHAMMTEPGMYSRGFTDQDPWDDDRSTAEAKWLVRQYIADTRNDLLALESAVNES